MRYIVTADPPTPNGDLHVGHLAGPYFAADVLTRALRLQGHAVAFLSNYDAHQSYVVTTARHLGWTTRQVVQHFSERIARVFDAYAIEPDLVGRPDEAQRAYVCRFFERLHERGMLLERDEELPWCDRCQLSLFETFIQGLCPHCGAGCYGNTCEVCVLPNSPKDIREPRCRHCGEPPSSRRAHRGLYLSLSRYQSTLRDYLETRRGIWRSHFFEHLWPHLDAPLPDIPLTQPSDYGLPVSIPGFPDQVYNVRVEIFPALLHTFELWRRVEDRQGWGAAETFPDDTRVVHFHGYENAFQYGVTFHALAIAAGELAWGLPYASLSNEFYLLEGEKFSTTRRHAIWGLDLLRLVPSDPLRFYLAWTNPELTETNLELEDLRDVTDRHLIDPWNRLHRVAGKIFEEGVDDAGAGYSPGFTARLAAFEEKMTAAYAVESLSLSRAAQTVAGWLTELGDAVSREHHAELLAGLDALAIAAQPILPRFARRLASSLGLGAPIAWQGLRPVRKERPRWPDELLFEPLAKVELDACRQAG